jgi:hypothetical protein
VNLGVTGRRGEESDLLDFISFEFILLICLKRGMHFKMKAMIITDCDQQKLAWSSIKV